MASPLARVALLLALGLGQAADPVVVGMTWTTSSLDPREGSTPWSLTTHGLAEKLFTVDKNGDIVGQVASSATLVSDYVWDVTLNTDQYFSDGTVVTGHAQGLKVCERAKRDEVFLVVHRAQALRHLR